ncbi:MAG TPA: putative nucleotide-diphospho-sugar transferase [Pirellulales bacterium]|nr:putative nucleotide-diphospho-sugar transferase [Pirellulales bacterium]
MKLAFLTLFCGEEFSRMAAVVNPAKSRYCDRFGYQGTHDGPNAGLFFIRNSAWSFQFMHAIYQHEQFIHHPWWEQAAIIELLNREDVRSHVQVYPLGQRQGGFHGFRIHDDWGSIFIHHASLRGPERLTLIENLVRLAELPPALRLHTRAALGPLLNRLRLLVQAVARRLAVRSGTGVRREMRPPGVLKH